MKHRRMCLLACIIGLLMMFTGCKRIEHSSSVDSAGNIVNITSEYFLKKLIYTKSVNTNGLVEEWEYDTNGNEKIYKNSLGSLKEYEDGKIVHSIEVRNDGTSSEYKYNDSEQPIYQKEVDDDGWFEASFFYDDQGTTLHVLLSDGTTVDQWYNNQNELYSQKTTMPNGDYNIQRISYDEAGQVLDRKTNYPDGSWTETQYGSGNERKEKTVFTDGSWIETVFDFYGYATKEKWVYSDGSWDEYKFDKQGNRILVMRQGIK